jgi:two-component system sensor histidine kinase DegS
MAEQAKEKTDPKEELLELLASELKQMKAKMDEINAQIDQTRLVVDRAEMHNADIATELRTVEDQLETVPRQDIKAKYDEALDARFRLTTMRGQLERFQATSDALTTHHELLTHLRRKLQGVSAIDDGDETSGAIGLTGAGVNIVRMIQAQEEERERVARQMHDGPAQSLTNFILQTEICQRLFDRNPARAAEELGNLKSAASVTFQKVRDFIFDLRPMMLTDLGVVPTVRRYVDSFKEKNDIDIQLEILGEERRLEPHREVMLFRGIQELMGHARDYAAPGKLSIRLDMSGNRINATVEDDGRGFDAEAAFMGEETYQDSRTQGLITLKEKYELINGAVSVFSSEGEGTTVRLELPISDEVS